MGFLNDAKGDGFFKVVKPAQGRHPACWSAASAVVRLDSPVKPENDAQWGGLLMVVVVVLF